MEYGNEDAVNRLLSVIEGNNSGISKEVNWEGGGSFIYAELIKINQYYIDKIHKANDNQLMNIFTEIEKNAIIVYNADLVKFKENIEIFNCLSSDIKRNILLSFLDKNQLYINYSEIDDIEYDISEEIIKFNKKFYNLK